MPDIGVGGGHGKEGDKDDDLEDDAEEVTARNPRVAKRPAAPTKAMVLAHEVHHADYREWCAHCVAGKGVSHQHRSSEKEEDANAEFSMDHAFLTAEDKVGYREDLGEEHTSGASQSIAGYDHGY